MKIINLTFTALLISTHSFAVEDTTPIVHEHHHDMGIADSRTTLNLSPQMKQHQLSNMRGHVVAIQSIIGLMAEQKFTEAAQVAHSQLGLTPDMQSMCSKMGDEKFHALGYAFHKSGDDLGDTLQSKDLNASLRALNTTMSYCVSCHASYRQ